MIPRRFVIYVFSLCSISFLTTCWIWDLSSTSIVSRDGPLLLEYDSQRGDTKSRDDTKSCDIPSVTRDVSEYRHIGVSTLHDRFHHMTRDTCINECDSGVKDSSTMCRARIRSHWNEAFVSGLHRGVSLFSDTEFVFPWELQYLMMSPLDDLKSLPDLELSRVYPVSNMKVSKGGMFVLRMGQTASFRVDLYDRYGHPRVEGGDEVRVWISGHPGSDVMTDVDRFDESSATGLVRDLTNGSYLITVTPVWKGMAKVNIAVVYPREYLRVAIHQSRVGSHRFIFGKFWNSDAEEVTVCHATPNIPGRPCVCNLTDTNNLPFYCGKPLDKRLSCQDWTFFSTAPTPAFKDVTPAEQMMDEQMSRPAKLSLIKTDIRIQIQGPDGDPVLPLCKDTSLRKSWTKMFPRGLWSKFKTEWTSLICREPDMTPEWIRHCLKDTNIWITGDSNMRHLTSIMAGYLGCSKKNNWPFKYLCRNERFNTTLYFLPHEYPLSVSNRWLKRLDKRDVADMLASIPSTGYHVVFHHYYLHQTFSHSSVLFQRLTSLKHALTELIAKNHHVFIAVLGPHVSTVKWEVNHMLGGDVLGSFIRGMYVEVFRGMQDRVLFLDGWDRTIALENEKFHPPRPFSISLWRSLLAFKCGRQFNHKNRIQNVESTPDYVNTFNVESFPNDIDHKSSHYDQTTPRRKLLEKNVLS